MGVTGRNGQSRVGMAQVGLECPKYVTYILNVFLLGTSRWERLSYLKRSIKYVCHVADKH